MRNLLAGLSVAVALCLSPAAMAQDDAPSPEAVAANKANTDKILADGGATAFFSNQTDHNNRMDVRHANSGVFCQFQREATNRLTLADASGDSFVCSTRDTNLKVSFSLTVRRTSLDPKAERKAAEAALKARLGKIRTIVEPGVSRAIMTPEQHKWATTGHNRYFTSDDGIVRRQSILVMKTGWLVILDAEAPRDSFAALELMTDVIWMDAVLGAVAKARDDAVKAGQATP